MKAEQQEIISQFAPAEVAHGSPYTGKNSYSFSMDQVFARLRKVEKKSMMILVKPLSSLMKCLHGV